MQNIAPGGLCYVPRVYSRKNLIKKVKKIESVDICIWISSASEGN
jgi:hypothetical protein